MSRENVEVVRVSLASWNAEDMEAIRETYDPGVIVRPPVGWPEPGPFVGRDAVMRQWEQLRQTFDEDALELLSDFIDAGERVAVRVCWRGSGHGPEANLEMTDVFTVRKGRIFYLECFWDHAAALDCLGLSEQDAHAESSPRDTGRALSESNVQTLRDSYEWVGVKGTFPAHLATPGVIWDLSHFQGWLGQQVYEGVQAVEDFFADWGSVWDSWEPAVEAMHDVGDKVVAILRVRGRSKMSGTPIEMSMAQVVTFRDGKQARTDNYSDVDEALKTVGLES